MPPRAGSQDVRAQSVQPGRGGGGFDARAQSVQRPRENYGLRFSQWKEPRGSANGAGDSSMYTKNGRLKVAEPIEEVVFEPPKAAPHVAPLYHPPWSKAPPAALPVVASEPSTVSYVPGASSSAHAAATKPASKASAAKTSFFTSMTTIKLHCVHLRHLSADVTDNMLHYLIPNHWAGDQQPSAVEFKPPTETEEGSGVFRRQAKYFFNENKDARAFVEFVRDKDAKGKLVRLKQDPNKPLAVSASHAPVCVPPSAVFLYPGQVSVS
ncbi:hypothetical protein BCR44DRAFT_1428671 [Catenaria anguillulae PL171]|uniref:Uncharacterized protein n=1 Tax=Catenaria anguillulae PL171 TaxID=765915 RepID=A0A1Y2HY35_9FUNG|nr:hypothetical protein BCR44DRAFT_1428671 [Catenaria anguillulae PL171]